MKVENLVIARYKTSIFFMLTQESSIISNLAYILINSLYIYLVESSQLYLLFR